MRPADLIYLRAAIAVSRSARANGNEPYGAVLVDAHGAVLGSAENTQVTGRDCTGHAEMTLLRDISPRVDRATLARATLYASGEPCPMCTGAIYWSGVGRVVYALGLDSMRALGGPGADELMLSCHEVLAHGTRNIEVLGPLLEDEARRVFEN